MLDEWSRSEREDVGRTRRLAGSYVAASLLVATVLGVGVTFGGQIKKQVFEDEVEVKFVPPEPVKAPPMSKVIASLLLVMAIMSLAVVVERWVSLLRAKGETRTFLRAVVPLLGELEYPRAAELADRHRASPFARLIAPILRKLTSTEEKNLTRVELARREAERQKEAVGEELRRGMGVLASVGSIAPFVGLLGTVVGIISVFQGIASTGSGNTPLTNPSVFNATLCGKNTDPTGAQFGALIRRNARGSYNNVLFQGFEANVDIRDPSTAAAVTGPGSPALTFKGSVFGKTLGAGVLENVGYPETGAAAPDKDNDGALSELDWLKTPAYGNLFQDPAGIDCFNAKAPAFGPTTSLTTGAVAPPNDGFFDATATYMGAFKDASDTWATSGTWAIWDSE